MDKRFKAYQTEILVLASSFAVSYIISEWIHEHYYLLEYVFLILLFGLIQEAWSSLQTKEGVRDFVQVFGFDSRTGMQIALLWFIGGAVFMSIQLRNFVESEFGTLSVVQMLALIVILSRAFVSVYDSQDVLGILDGERDTYAAYTAGLVAMFVSWQIRDSYAVYTIAHNLLVIWTSILLPWLLYYHSGLGDSLPSLKTKIS